LGFQLFRTFNGFGEGKMKKLMVLALVSVLCISAAHATVTFTKTGTSAKDVDVEFEAQLTISGDDLTIELRNNSLQSLNPDDLLSSFYFDIVSGGVRPTLTYVSGSGDVYLDDGTTESLVQAGADLVATAMFDNTWQFLDFGAEMQPPTTSNVTGGFGLGTVGNGAVDNNFNGSITGGIDYSIYAPPVDTANLENAELVRDSATFTFSGVNGYTEADIVDLYAFGLGTAPDSLLIPEPATLAILGLGSLVLIRKKQE
jgi:hypothetical protein